MKEKLEKLATPILKRRGLRLVEVAVRTPRHGRGRSRVRFIINRPGGVTVGECEEVSHFLEGTLDLETPPLLEGPYVLEVSSPGVDRPLRSREDFEEVAGRPLRVLQEDGTEISGELVRLEEDSIVLRCAAAETRISISRIRQARQTLPW